MGIENRPFIGSWQLNQKGLVRHVPDALVYVNGKAVLPGCPTCGGQVDIQKYISAITVDPSIEAVASASITLQIPKAEEASMFRDGQFLMQTGMEINIYIRGYFPVAGLHSDTPPEMTGGVDLTNSVMYPYYHVFHGVVTEVSHEYSGGEHTASLTCRDMLHFWSYQVMSTSGSYLGGRPMNSGVRMSFVGHTFTGMTPYQIIYTLYRDVMGAAASVGFALGSESNKDAQSSALGEGLWSMALLYWQKRFSQNFNSLRMFGMDGTLYNAYQQALLGRLGTNDLTNLAKRFADPEVASQEFDAESDLKARAAREVAFDPVSLYAGAAAEDDAKKGGLGVNVAQIQAFVSDISNFGNVNLFETEYQSKLDMATTVREVTGFEFFQDVDGDFVFKPPFYNLDTSGSRAYVIRDVDIISISFSDTEPQATYVKATGTHFRNMAGLGFEGNEWGTRTEFIDYRLVAQYGWREASFETYYLTDPRAMFFAAVNRLDLENIGIHSASLQIPIRPEIRPGYPVYLEPFDCFFYAQSFNHSFTFGGQCTTSLNLVGRRAKFFPPGVRPEDGTAPTVDDVKLNNPWLPKLPLRVRGNDQQLRYQGFPNVVLAIDPEALNPNFVAAGLATQDFSTETGIAALVAAARDVGVLLVDEDRAEGQDEKEKWKTGPFKLLAGNGGEHIPIPTVGDLVAQGRDYQRARDEVAKANRQQQQVYADRQRDLDSAERNAEPLLRLIEAVKARGRTGIADGEQLANYLEALGDLKATFAPGKSIPGHYRYYSSSHPDPEMQGMREVTEDDTLVAGTSVAGLVSVPKQRLRGIDNIEGENRLVEIDVVAGLPIMRPNTGTQNGTRAVPTPTHQIGTIAIAQHQVKKQIRVPKRSGVKNRMFGAGDLRGEIGRQLAAAALNAELLPLDTRFEDNFSDIRSKITEVLNTIGLQESVTLATFGPALSQVDGEDGQPLQPSDIVEDRFSSDPREGVYSVADGLARLLSSTPAIYFRQRFKQLEDQYGPVSSEDTSEEKIAAFDALDKAWSDLFSSFNGSAPDEYTNHNTVMVTKTVEISKYSPVFPVSDAGGYELIGSYLYGRGLTVEPGGNFQRLMASERFAHVSVEAVDEFIGTLLRGDNDENAVSPSKALGIIAQDNPEVAAELAVAGGILPSDSTGVEVLSISDLDAGQFDTAFRNFTATTKQAAHKITARNAAFNLTDLGKHIGSGSCSCQAGDADVLLKGLDGEFVQVTGQGAIEEWVRERSRSQVRPWQSAQDAMRGRSMERSTRSLSEAFRRAGDRIRSGYERSVGQVQGRIGEFEDAQDRLDADVQGFRDTVASRGGLGLIPGITVDTNASDLVLPQTLQDARTFTDEGGALDQFRESLTGDDDG